MKSTIVLTFSGLIAAAYATDNFQLAPRETDAAKKHQIPLPPPAPTAAPIFRPREIPALFKRQDTTEEQDEETCGLYSNGEAHVCAATSACSSSGDYFGCCDGASCPISTACLDSDASECVAGTEGLQTLCCTFDVELPYCVTIISTNDAGSYTDLRCGDIQYASEVQTITALEDLDSTATAIQTNDPEISDAPEEDTTGTDTADATTEADSGSTDDSNADTGGDNNSNNNDDGGASSSKSNTGAIVGGVIGGIAVLGLLGLGFFFLRKKMNKNSKPDHGGNGASSSYQQAPQSDMGQTYDGSSPSGQYLPTPHQQYQQPGGQQGYSPYANTVSPAGYAPTTAAPSPQTTLANANSAGTHQSFYGGVGVGQDGLKENYVAVAEVDGTSTNKTRVELA
ncbi:hypothetical protein MKZ38_007555 [Zalerion maritima]|uniref:Mid2 domain-containing protein n=1 Tax=Zalerion maritima TaxID=339359 RepID=A0AAD5WN70_9PEZI|nr:hypothetical protein MKZ38_007555 [Zalerion maritima]